VALNELAAHAARGREVKTRRQLLWERAVDERLRATDSEREAFLDEKRREIGHEIILVLGRDHQRRISGRRHEESILMASRSPRQQYWVRSTHSLANARRWRSLEFFNTQTANERLAGFAQT